MINDDENILFIVCLFDDGCFLPEREIRSGGDSQDGQRVRE